MTEQEIAKRVRQALTATKAADRLAEKASMLTYDAFRALNFGGKTLSIQGESMRQRTDRAHSELSDARGELGDAAYQLERALKPLATGRDHRRRPSRR